MSELTDLFGALLRVVAILLRHNSSWANSITTVAAGLAEAENEPDRQIALRKLLSMYGGMGSFNDLVIQSSSGVSPDNNELDELRSRVYALASALIR